MPDDLQDDTFEFDYPLFFIAERLVPADEHPSGKASFRGAVKLKGPDLPGALAVFTDREAAEEFRDRNQPTHKVFEVANRILFLDLLRAIQEEVVAVAFDPLRAGMRTALYRIEAVIEAAETSD